MMNALICSVNYTTSGQFSLFPYAFLTNEYSIFITLFVGGMLVIGSMVISNGM
jgi:hypothetical protein